MIQDYQIQEERTFSIFSFSYSSRLCFEQFVAFYFSSSLSSLDPSPSFLSHERQGHVLSCQDSTPVLFLYSLSLFCVIDSLSLFSVYFCLPSPYLLSVSKFSSFSYSFPISPSFFLPSRLTLTSLPFFCEKSLFSFSFLFIPFLLLLQNSTLSIEDFHQRIQDITRYPLRPYVVSFLRLHLPILQSEVERAARLSSQTPSQYIDSNESLILDPPLSRSSTERSVTSSSVSQSSTNFVYFRDPHHQAFLEGFEIFQPPHPPPQHSIPPPPSVHTNNQYLSTPSYYYGRLSPVSPSSSMGIKEAVASATVSSIKRPRLSPPDSRKENGYEESDVPPIKRVNNGHTTSVRPVSSSLSSTLHVPTTHSHHQLPLHHLSSHHNHYSHSPVPLHPLHSNGTALLHNQMSIRATTAPSEHQESRISNGFQTSPREGLRGGHSAEPSRYEVRGSVTTTTSPTSGNSSSVDIHLRPPTPRAIAEELTRESEEEWKNIHTVSLHCVN